MSIFSLEKNDSGWKIESKSFNPDSFPSFTKEYVQEYYDVSHSIRYLSRGFGIENILGCIDDNGNLNLYKLNGCIKYDIDFITARSEFVTEKGIVSCPSNLVDKDIVGFQGFSPCLTSTDGIDNSMCRTCWSSFINTLKYINRENEKYVGGESYV